MYRIKKKIYILRLVKTTFNNIKLLAFLKIKYNWALDKGKDNLNLKNKENEQEQLIIQHQLIYLNK